MSQAALKPRGRAEASPERTQQSLQHQPSITSQINSQLWRRAARSHGNREFLPLDVASTEPQTRSGHGGGVPVSVHPPEGHEPPRFWGPFQSFLLPHTHFGTEKPPPISTGPWQRPGLSLCVTPALGDSGAGGWQCHPEPGCGSGLSRGTDKLIIAPLRGFGGRWVMFGRWGDGDFGGRGGPKNPSAPHPHLSPTSQLAPPAFPVPTQRCQPRAGLYWSLV